MGHSTGISKILPWNWGHKTKNNYPFVMSKSDVRKISIVTENLRKAEFEYNKSDLSRKKLDVYIQKQLLKIKLKHADNRPVFAPH